MSDKHPGHKYCPVCGAAMVVEWDDYILGTQLGYRYWCGCGYRGEEQQLTVKHTGKEAVLLQEWERLQAQEKETP